MQIPWTEGAGFDTRALLELSWRLEGPAVNVRGRQLKTWLCAAVLRRRELYGLRNAYEVRTASAVSFEQRPLWMACLSAGVAW